MHGTNVKIIFAMFSFSKQKETRAHKVYVTKGKLQNSWPGAEFLGC